MFSITLETLRDSVPFASLSHRNRLPREAVDAPSLEPLEVRSDRALSNPI